VGLKTLFTDQNEVLNALLAVIAGTEWAAGVLDAI